MTYSLARTPTWLLFFASALPILMGECDSSLFAPAIVFASVFFSFWLYSIAKELTKRNTYAPPLNFTKFTLVLTFAVAYTILLSGYFYFIGANNDDANWVIAVICIGQFIFLYWFIFILNFISRSIATVGLQKSVGFDQYAGYFFCLFFFPIGIWWVNPKIKDLLSQK